VLVTLLMAVEFWYVKVRNVRLAGQHSHPRARARDETLVLGRPGARAPFPLARLALAMGARAALMRLTVFSHQNVSGRKLVGLRYWNYTSESGENEWQFESRDAEGMATIQAEEKRLFWGTLYLMARALRVCAPCVTARAVLFACAAVTCAECDPAQCRTFSFVCTAARSRCCGACFRWRRC
jgi:hypothetical protein